MEYDKKHIVEEIVEYIKSCGSRSDSWYVGVTSDPLRCLQYEHGICVINTLCTYREVSTVNMATDIVSVLINKYGLDGKTEVDGDEHSTYVYAFLRINSSYSY